MSKLRGTSQVPMVMGIIGGLIGIPAAFCAGACAAGITGAAGQSNSSEIGTTYMAMCIIGSLLGLIFGLLSKRMPKASGLVMILAAMLTGITLIAGNMMALITAILFLVGGAISLTQKKEAIE